MRLLGLLAVQRTQGVHEPLEERPLLTSSIGGSVRVLVIAERGQFLLVTLVRARVGVFGGVGTLTTAELSLESGSCGSVNVGAIETAVLAGTRAG